jgi:hypothetical protein
MSKDFREQIRPQAAIVQRVFATEQGKELLNLMTLVFQGGELMGATPELTAYNVGQHELVEYLKELNTLEAGR